MRKITITLLTIILLAGATVAQNRPIRQGDQPNGATLTGKVVDADSGSPLEYTNISIFTQRDSTLVTGGITNASGLFAITTRPGRFFVKIQFISYKDKVLPDVRVAPGAGTVDLGTITLGADTETLDEVVVTGEKDQVEMTLDKRVFNVGKDLSNAGRTAADILDNVPSVAVDQEGNVSLRGSENVRILVDGKPSGLVGISSTDALRQMQGDMIERVEVVTNPSARYDAEGSAGIINIILKKERERGLNGAITLNAGYPDNYGASFNLNYRTKNINWFANYGLRYRKSPGGGFSYQEYFYPTDEDPIAVSDQDIDRWRSGLSNSIRGGFEWFMSQNSSLTVAGLYRYSDELNERDTEYKDLDVSGELLEQSLRQEDEAEIDQTAEVSLNYRKTFKNDRQLLTADVQYRDSGEEEDADIMQTYIYGVGESDLQHTLNKENEKSWLLQTDYVHPFGKYGQVEFGYRGNFRRLRNNYIVEDIVDGEAVNLSNLSNNFRYNEYVNAAYAIIGNKVNKFSYQLGLRMEATNIETYLAQTDETNKKEYLNLFPSTHFTYDLGDNNNLQASYSRRLRRPRSRSLNPFISIADNRNFRTGNPDLNPSYTNSFELGYLKTWPKASLYSSVYYRHTTDDESRVTVRVDSVFITRPVNIGTEDAYGFEFNYSVDFTEWWRMNGSTNLYRAITDGSYTTQFNDRDSTISLTRDTYTMSARLNSRMTVWKKLDVQTNLRYRAPQKTTQGERKSITSLDIGLSIDVLKGKGTLVANVNDVFNNRKYRGITEGEDFRLETEFQWRPRSYSMTFTYRLNQKKNRRNRDRREEDGDDGDFDM